MNTKNAAASIAAILKVLRSKDPDIPLQRAEAFLHIAAAKEPMNITDVQNALGATLASASRHVAELGKQGRLRLIDGEPGRSAGLNLVEAFEDPMNRRAKLVRLTKSGETLLEKVTAELEKAGGKASR